MTHWREEVESRRKEPSGRAVMGSREALERQDLGASSYPSEQKGAGALQLPLHLQCNAIFQIDRQTSTVLRNSLYI